MTSQTSSYVYDALGQLISEGTPGLVTNTYTYNAAGNRTSAVLKGVSCTYTTPAAHNRLASWTGGGSMTYNLAGCVTSLNRTTNKVDISSLSWDSQYQLTSAVAGNIGVYYSYDALGRKIERVDGDGGYEYYFYDGNQIVADFDGNESRVIRSYTYGPGIDNILSMTVHGSTSTNTYYYLKDLSNTVLSLVNASGIAVEYYEYDAYGNVTIRNGSGNVIPTSAYGNRFLFQGREYDYTTQLYNFRARWYDPETGRWLSNDPIGISGGLNLYAFCSNDPVNFVDPMGWAGKAYFAKRPLDMAGGEFLFNWVGDGAGFLDLMNLGLYHEHIFFEGNVNCGFFDNGNGYGEVRRDNASPLLLSKYVRSSEIYDSDLLMEAMMLVNQKIGDHPPFKLKGRGKNNCQDWSDAVRLVYWQLYSQGRRIN